MEDLKSYRLNSMEEPTDEQLQALMEQVAIEARKTSQKAEEELKRRMKETELKIAELKKQNTYVWKK
ncbi:MAG: hypothetical protein Q4D56_04100 [Bacteroides sp.]|nr:hypothetical protein [Bacteroides sp.]